jgi:glycosyltransferase involved in cell wall biosynthesis
MDTVSVVIPVYNRADCIRYCLDSVFAQTYPAIEVIVVDDGSTDDLESVLAPVMSQIKFLKQQNQGQGAARNAGARAASGRYLAFLDSDDWWASEKLSEQIASIEKSGFVWSHTKTLAVTKNDDGQVVSEGYYGDWYCDRRSGFVAQQLLQTNFICTSSVLIEKHIFADIGGFCADRSLQDFEDYELWLRLAAHYPVDYCERPAVYYVKHEGVLAISEVSAQIQKNDLVMDSIAKNCAQAYPLTAIKRRRYHYREHLFRVAIRQGERKPSRHILDDMWRFNSFLGRNLLNTGLYITPDPILKRIASFVTRRSKRQESD